MKINIAQGLKIKNRLTAEIKEIDTQLRVHNVIEDGVTPDYDTATLLQRRQEITDEVVAIKAAISRANGPVVSLIYKQAEYRGLIVTLKGMQVTARRQRAANMETVSFTPQISAKVRDQKVKELEKIVNEIQDELDRFNHSTLIEV